MKGETDIVFSIVKRMTKGEKKYFQLINTKPEEKDISNRMLLYKLIDKPSDTNISIPKKFNNYKVVKNQLYNLLVETLSNYQLKNNATWYSDKIILKAKTLLIKGMYKECLSFIEKVTPELETREFFIALISLFEIKDKALVYHKPYQEFFTSEGSNLDMISNLLDKHQNYSDAKSFNQELVYVCSRTSREGYVSEIEAVKDKFYHKLEQLEKEAVSNKALRTTYASKIYFHSALGEFELAKTYQIKMNKLTRKIHKNGGLSIEFVSYGIINLITIELRLGNYDIKDSLQEHLKIEEKIKRTHQKLLSTLTRYYCQVLCFWKTNKIKRINEIYATYPGQISKNIGQIEPRLELNVYNAFLTCLFLDKQYHEANLLCKRLLTKFDANASINVYSFCLLIDLFIHFEIGNHQLLESLSKSVKRKLKNLNKLDQLINRVLNFFANGLQKKSNPDLSTLFLKLISQSKLPNEMITAEFSIDLLLYNSCFAYYWINAKSKNKDLKSYLEEETAIKFV